jgi:hypothetical protein
VNDPYGSGQPPYGGGQPPYGGSQPPYGGQPPYNPNWAPSPAPAPSRTGAGPIVAVFVGVLITLAVIAGVIVFLNQPPPPETPCPPAQPCAPVPSLPPVASSPVAIPTLKPVPSTTIASPGASAQPGTTPNPGASVAPPATPTSDSPPVVSGTLYTDASLGYSFEYDPDVFTLAQNADGSAVFSGNFFDAQVWVDAKPAETSVAKMINSELDEVDRFFIARVPDTDTYDALLGPSVGYVPGDGGVWSGTLVSRDGTPLAPGGVTIAAASDGRITVAVVIIVGSPDIRQAGDTQQHAVRQAADDLLKSFNWSAQ